LSRLDSDFDTPIVLRRATNFRANNLIASLPEQELRALTPLFRLVELTFEEPLYEYRGAIESVYFPLDSVVSSLVLMEDGSAIETAMIGREGLVGVASLLGRPDARLWTRVTVGGTALSLDRRYLNRLFTESSSVQRVVLIAYRRLISQVSQRAVCNARHSIMERLCGWLLMIHDRVGGDDLRLTHEVIAMRLGSRRAGITQAATMLKAMRAISYVRGRIVITDRHVLEHSACECYEVFRTDFDPDSALGPITGSSSKQSGNTWVS
jgi:CRP-like cAMP-binding protein